MSRTYRRKKAPYNFNWVLRTTVWENKKFSYVYLDKNSNAVKKAIARYFSDADCGSYGSGTAPHWCRRYLNHRADRREEKLLNQYLRNPEFDLIFLPRVKDASNFF